MRNGRSSHGAHGGPRGITEGKKNEEEANAEDAEDAGAQNCCLEALVLLCILCERYSSIALQGKGDLRSENFIFKICISEISIPVVKK